MCHVNYETDFNSGNVSTLNLIYNDKIKRGFRRNDPFQLLIRENLLKVGLGF